MAVIKIGRSPIKTQVHEASIDGFTVLVDSSDASRLVLGKPWILLHDNAKIEVHAQWFFHADDGNVQIGLRRLRDLTKPPVIGGWFPSFFATPREDGSSGSLLFVGASLIVMASLAMPGVGDALGTSGKIQQAFGAIYHGICGYFD
ncbi:hypothetical protein [Neorhodopirellula pilleata]|nr:hypothetical protein [Neorhodopirellula pilleata]